MFGVFDKSNVMVLKQTNKKRSICSIENKKLLLFTVYCLVHFTVVLCKRVFKMLIYS